MVITSLLQYHNNSNDEDFDNIEDDILLLLATTAVLIVDHSLKYMCKEPCRTSALTGHGWVQELLYGHDIRCYENFRMEKYMLVIQHPLDTWGHINVSDIIFLNSSELLDLIFDVWKNRFVILHRMPKFKYSTQVQLVIATMIIHNFIRQNCISDHEFKIVDDHAGDGDISKHMDNISFE
ncbi:hypothetical protein Lal_00017060 [Lupinus albus]|nr:hypothetical protein Lal_00017060 [Lupinus albus]